MRQSRLIALGSVWMLVCFLPTIVVAQGNITQAVLGTGVTKDFDIVNPATEFAPDTPKIFCAWKAEGVKVGTPARGV